MSDQRVSTGGRSRIVAPVIAATASIVVSLLVAEFVFRGYRRAAYQKAVAVWTNSLFCVLPPQRYFGCLPNVDHVATIDQEAGTLRVTYHTDAGGFRVQPPVEAGPNTRRVLCLGDSYTFGLAVADDQTYPCHLQNILRERGLDVAVSNRGIPGYNTMQEYHTLREVFDTIAPDVVVLGYVMNDAEPVTIVPLTPDLGFKYCRSWLFEASKPAINAAARWLVCDQPLCRPRQVDAVLDYRKSFAWDSPKWKESRDALAAIHAYLRERNVPLLVFIQPAFTERFDEAYEFFLLHDRVKEWAACDGYPAFDLLPLFWGEDRRDLWVEGDGHPAGPANRRMAVAMATECERVLR